MVLNCLVLCPFSDQNGSKTIPFGAAHTYIQGRKKPRSDCPGQVNFALGQAKIEVSWPGGQVKLASAVLLVIIPVKNN